MNKILIRKYDKLYTQNTEAFVSKLVINFYRIVDAVASSIEQ